MHETKTTAICIGIMQIFNNIHDSAADTMHLSIQLHAKAEIKTKHAACGWMLCARNGRLVWSVGAAR